MKIYRYARKQYIKLNKQELNNLRKELTEASASGAWGAMRSPIDGLDLEIDRLNFGRCIGCAWLQILIHHTPNTHGAQWGFNTFLKEIN